MVQSNTQTAHLNWYRRAPWLILVTGLVLALVVTAFLFMALMQPPLAEMGALISTLALTSLLSLGLGYYLYQRKLGSKGKRGYQGPYFPAFARFGLLLVPAGLGPVNIPPVDLKHDLRLGCDIDLVQCRDIAAADVCQPP